MGVLKPLLSKIGREPKQAGEARSEYLGAGAGVIVNEKTHRVSIVGKLSKQIGEEDRLGVYIGGEGDPQALQGNLYIYFTQDKEESFRIQNRKSVASAFLTRAITEHLNFKSETGRYKLKIKRIPIPITMTSGERQDFHQLGLPVDVKAVTRPPIRRKATV